jgi:hypothetical protein
MSVNSMPQGNAQFQQLAQAFPFLQTLYSQGQPSPLGQNPFYNWYTPGRQPGAMTNFPTMPPQGPGNLIAPPVGAQAPTVVPQGQTAGIPPGTVAPMAGMNPGQSAYPGLPPGAVPPAAGPPYPGGLPPGGGPPYPGQVSTPLGGGMPPPPSPLFPPPQAPASPAAAAQAATPTPTGLPGANAPLTQAMLLQLYPWLATYGMGGSGGGMGQVGMGGSPEAAGLGGGPVGRSGGEPGGPAGGS